VAELRKTIDKLRQSGADAGLIKIKRTDSDKAVSSMLRQESVGSVQRPGLGWGTPWTLSMRY